MGRIDEALQRLGDSGPKARRTEDREELFRSAWDVPAAAHEQPAIPGVTAGPNDLRIAKPLNPVADPPGAIAFASTWRERLAGGADADPSLVEQFRRLAASLHHAHKANGLRTVMVTSASPDDGKTLTTVNLALVLSESYRYNVLLVDADLRRPSIPNVADVTDGRGLSEVLRAPTDQKVALVPITSRLTLLPAGQPIANSIEALTSPRMQFILEEAAAHFDWVLLDAPPVGPAADAHVLTEWVGGTLFVIHAGRTQYHDIQKALDTIGRDQILGVVLNGVDPKTLNGHYYAAGNQPPKR